MWTFVQPISLLRYLVVWRINGSLVWLPDYLPADISLVLGTLIADRLPTTEALPWRKALAAWESSSGPAGDTRHGLPSPGQQDTAWPLQSVIFVYPGKRSYGLGELLFWELKLLGNSADHGLFLELILPAMEEAATTRDPRWKRPRTLWGRFDIHAIYAARGQHWEPIVQAGQLNLRYTPTHGQWAEGWDFQVDRERVWDRLSWLTPFDLTPPTRAKSHHRLRSRKQTIPDSQIPTLPALLDALLDRMRLFLPRKRATIDDVLASLEAADRSAFEATREQVASIPLLQHSLQAAPKGWPKGWIGRQQFAVIPPEVIPYLELAAILHIGRHTHFGYGTFTIS